MFRQSLTRFFLIYFLYALEKIKTYIKSQKIKKKNIDYMKIFDGRFWTPIYTK